MQATHASAYNDACFNGLFSLGTARNDMGAHGGPGACGWASPLPPSIVAAPRSQNSCLGQPASFTATAEGADPLTYQWHFNETVLTGATGAALTLTNLHSTQAGAYKVVLTNPYGTTNAKAWLHVYDACIDIHMYAGLSMAGQVGSQYVLSYTTDLGNTNSWVPLATNTMGASGWFYLDMESPLSPQRFYRADLRP